MDGAEGKTNARLIHHKQRKFGPMSVTRQVISPAIFSVEMTYDGKTGLAQEVLRSFAPPHAPLRAKTRFQVRLTLIGKNPRTKNGKKEEGRSTMTKEEIDSYLAAKRDAAKQEAKNDLIWPEKSGHGILSKGENNREKKTLQSGIQKGGGPPVDH